MTKVNVQLGDKARDTVSGFDDEPVCPCCSGDGMDPMTDYALPCPERGYGE